MSLYVACISSRNQFGDLLNSLGLTGLAVEVGTHRGQFAESLLLTWRGKSLHCIDPWSIPPGYEHQATLLDKSTDRSEDLDEAARVAGRNPRMLLVRACSPEAAGRYSDGSIDFVYIDGDHRRDAVSTDLRAWWPKLRSGGLLAGHDVVCPGESHDGWGQQIQPALFEFTDLPIQLVVEENGLPWSYWVVKP